LLEFMPKVCPSYTDTMA